MGFTVKCYRKDSLKCDLEKEFGLKYRENVLLKRSSLVRSESSYSFYTFSALQEVYLLRYLRQIKTVSRTYMFCLILTGN